ncbi:hypothetical protein BJ875DRAFT_468061 [Amylocarpus encephaloides]|uniref:Kinesin light chain n=1 Tax=Amylocarpus encephaloides TaxID=45428 RepID=A0A9P7YEG4_9HELO|nr:hypothetical protein BJ875DRAFT_468061 [Amylocarpus encephaloides]
MILYNNREESKFLNATARFGLFLDSQGRYQSSKQMIRHALEGRLKILGQEHPNTLGSMNNLAGLLKSQGKYDEA